MNIGLKNLITSNYTLDFLKQAQLGKRKIETNGQTDWLTNWLTNWQSQA